MTEIHTDPPEIRSTGHLLVTRSAFHGFVGNFPKKVLKYFESHFKTLKRDDNSTRSADSAFNSKDSSTTWAVNLHKQLQAWKENPVWVEPSPKITVTIPKGSLCNLNVTVDVVGKITQFSL